MAWWTLTTLDVEPSNLNESQQEHIADLIKKGFTSGDLDLDEEQEERLK